MLLLSAKSDGRGVRALKRWSRRKRQRVSEGCLVGVLQQCRRIKLRYERKVRKAGEREGVCPSKGRYGRRPLGVPIGKDQGLEPRMRFVVVAVATLPEIVPR